MMQGTKLKQQLGEFYFLEVRLLKVIKTANNCYPCSCPVVTLVQICPLFNKFSLLFCQTSTNAWCEMADVNRFATIRQAVSGVAVAVASNWLTTSGHAKASASHQQFYVVISDGCLRRASLEKRANRLRICIQENITKQRSTYKPSLEIVLCQLAQLQYCTLSLELIIAFRVSRSLQSQHNTF